MNALARHPDIAVTISTGAILLVLDTTIGLPWVLWLIYAAIVAVQVYWKVTR